MNGQSTCDPVMSMMNKPAVYLVKVNMFLHTIYVQPSTLHSPVKVIPASPRHSCYQMYYYHTLTHTNQNAHVWTAIGTDNLFWDG